jgi:hypothetical protein
MFKDLFVCFKKSAPPVPEPDEKQKEEAADEPVAAISPEPAVPESTEPVLIPHILRIYTQSSPHSHFFELTTVSNEGVIEWHKKLAMSNSEKIYLDYSSAGMTSVGGITRANILRWQISLADQWDYDAYDIYRSVSYRASR